MTANAPRGKTGDGREVLGGIRGSSAIGNVDVSKNFDYGKRSMEWKHYPRPTLDGAANREDVEDSVAGPGTGDGSLEAAASVTPPGLPAPILP